MAVLAPRIMRGITLVANDNINLAITLEEMTLPVMEEITETFHPGGADGEVDIAGLGTKAAGGVQPLRWPAWRAS